MKVIQLPVDRRTKTGSAESRRLRRDGRLPVNLYGLGRDPANLTVDAHDFDLKFQKGHRMFELTLDGQAQMCFLKDLGYDHLGTTVLHADLLRVDEKVPVTATVALEFVGNPDTPAGAILDVVRNDIHVTALPKLIPEHIEVHIGDLPVGERITVGDLKFPEGVTAVEDAARTIVTHHYKSAGQAQAAEGEGDDEGEEG